MKKLLICTVGILMSAVLLSCEEETVEPVIVCESPFYDPNGYLMYTQYIYDDGTCKVVYTDRTVGPYWVDWCTCN